MIIQLFTRGRWKKSRHKYTFWERIKFMIGINEQIIMRKYMLDSIIQQIFNLTKMKKKRTTENHTNLEIRKYFLVIIQNANVLNFLIKDAKQPVSSEYNVKTAYLLSERYLIGKYLHRLQLPGK